MEFSPVYHRPFLQFVKRQHKPLKAALEDAVEQVLAAPPVGEFKQGDLQGSLVPTTFSARKGVPLCLLAGVLSAVFSFSLAAGQPVADVAATHGAGHYQGNVIYLFSKDDDPIFKKSGEKILLAAAACILLDYTGDRQWHRFILKWPRDSGPLTLFY